MDGDADRADVFHACGAAVHFDDLVFRIAEFVLFAARGDFAVPAAGNIRVQAEEDCGFLAGLCGVVVDLLKLDPGFDDELVDVRFQTGADFRLVLAEAGGDDAVAPEPGFDAAKQLPSETISRPLPSCWSTRRMAIFELALQA